MIFVELYYIYCKHYVHWCGHFFENQQRFFIQYQKISTDKNVKKK